MTDVKLVLAAINRAIKADCTAVRRRSAWASRIDDARLAPFSNVTLCDCERAFKAEDEALNVLQQDIKTFCSVCADVGLDPVDAGLPTKFLKLLKLGTTNESSN